VDTLLSLARARPGELTLLTLGPLTNLAAALARDAGSLRQLRELVVMGGAFREAGNVTPVAEFNVFADPEAARAVCASDLKMRWVPLDVTHRCRLRRAALAELPDTRRVRFARQITDFYMRHDAAALGEDACYLHDPLAMAAVVWPDLLRTESLVVDVEIDGRLTRGMTVADLRPGAARTDAVPNAQVCLEVDAEAFVSRFLERLP